MKENSSIKIQGMLGKCGNLDVFLGFASASFLNTHSFADVLNEDTGIGYQRPRNIQHSKRFKEYIQKPTSSTIPLTFNLRSEMNSDWEIKSYDHYAVLQIKINSSPLAQVDCQHRLGELKDCNLQLAFMTFIGLELRIEMAMFNTINSNAKGLSRSLTDFIDSNLIENLVEDTPHLYIAKRLNEDPYSPWYRLVKYGGESVSGLKRKVSLRMLQQSIKKFLRTTKNRTKYSVPQNYELIRNYWIALKELFPEEWEDSRHHMLTKGVGLYALMYLLSDLVISELILFDSPLPLIKESLAPLKKTVDWDSKGELANFGGQKGAVQIYENFKKVVFNENIVG